MAAGVKLIEAPAAKAKKAPLTAEHQLELEKEKVKVKQEGLAEQVKLLTARNLELEQELETVDYLSKRTPQIITFAPKAPSGSSESVAIFVASDWHIEENVDPLTVSGKNDFNLEIAESRIQKFFQGSFRLFDIMRRDTTIKHIIVALLGDFITNTIHEDLQETNNLLPAQAIVLAEDKIASGIRFLLTNCPKDVTFTIVCHSGNHGRMTKKNRGSAEAGNSLEHYMYMHLQKYFSGEKRISWQIAEGYHTYVKLFDGNYNIRFHHGHAINYQGGVGGITIPVLKAIAQWDIAEKADQDIFGHFHQFLSHGKFTANGSLIGYNDFAIRIKAAYEKPTQAFLLINKKWNSKTMVTPVFLN